MDNIQLYGRTNQDVVLDDVSETDFSPTPAVDVDQLTFGYSSKNIIINNLKMRVPRSKIYSLLGSSGCGKTTLLRLIIGRLKPIQGQVRVFGRKPNEPSSQIPGAGVGFMPQELAITARLTVVETLRYYGSLYQMTDSQLLHRISFLTQLLDLRGLESQFVDRLSGGQRRRVSLAIALVHNPPLLILDEPTVGVDPLLRETIWMYLIQLTMRGMTVMITTHYIEEAKNGHTVSFMRNGHLLAEDNPGKLLRQYQGSTLESVFLTMAKREDQAHDRRNTLISTLQSIELRERNLDEEEQKASSQSEIQVQVSKFKASLSRVAGIFKKNQIRLRRRMTSLILNLLFPALQLVLYCICMGGDPKHMPLAVSNFTTRHNWTETFVQLLDKEAFDVKYFKTDRLANDSVKNTASYAAILFPENQLHVNVFLDASVALYSNTIKKEVAKTKEIFDKVIAGHTKQVVTVDFRYIYGSALTSMTDFMGPGMVVLLVFFGTTAVTSIAFLTERRDGSLERTLIAGATAAEFLAGQILMVIQLLAVQIVVTVLVGFWAFGMPMNGSFFWAVSLLTLQGICGMCYGLMVSALCTSEVSALLFGLGLMLPTTNITGMFWPTGTMPWILQVISWFFPHTFAMEAFRSIAIRGFGPDRFNVWLGFAITSGWIVVFLVVAIVVFKKR